MIQADESRAYQLATILETAAKKIRHGSYTAGWGHFDEAGVWKAIFKPLAGPSLNVATIALQDAIALRDAFVEKT